jgi:hypothetical protein
LVYGIVDNKRALKSIFQLILQLDPYSQYTVGHFNVENKFSNITIATSLFTNKKNQEDKQDKTRPREETEK